MPLVIGYSHTLMETSTMNFNDYQNESKQFLLRSANNAPYLFTGLAGEVGEVCSLYAKAVRDADSGIVTDALYKELGDVLWFVSQIATYYGISLDEIAKLNIAKLTDRLLRNKIGGTGNDR